MRGIPAQRYCVGRNHTARTYVRRAHTYHVIEPDSQIVYSYVMHHDDVRLSVSVASVELDPIDGDAATCLVYTEQGAYFAGGEAANAEREAGTIGLLKQLEASL